jgi:signal transduction histidine kinase
MQEVNQQVIVTIIAAVVLLILIGLIMLVLAVTYHNNKKRHAVEKEHLKSSFKQELLKAQLEIQEQTFTHVSQEIHDNIGQVLSFVKLSLGTASQLGETEKDERIAESKELVAKAITDLRDLSKSLSSDSFSAKGFLPAIKTEIERINKSKLVKASFIQEGKAISAGEQTELVLFRILQETVNNTLKHANAECLNISLKYEPELLTLTIADDGSGFDKDEAISKNGSGLRNIRNRANMIGATVEIKSTSGSGSEVKVCLNPLQQPYADRNHTSSSL